MSCSGDHLPAGVSDFPVFVSCSSNCITAVKFGVGNVAGWMWTWPGEAEEWGIFEEMQARMGENGFNSVNADIKWQKKNAAWKFYFLPCFLIWLKTKWRTNQQVVGEWEDTKQQSLENSISFGWKKNIPAVRVWRRNVGSLLWAGNPGGRGSLSRCGDALWKDRGVSRGVWNWLLVLWVHLSSLVWILVPCPSPQLEQGRSSGTAAGGAGLENKFQFLSWVTPIISHSAHNS